MHPAKVQLRGFNVQELMEIEKIVKNAKVIKTRDGVDMIFENVNDARFFISKLKARFSLIVKMSTESLGFDSRPRYLFVYSVRKRI
ncbi:MAG: NMD3-related protein [Archaeoglobaceae archaeon]